VVIAALDDRDVGVDAVLPVGDAERERDVVHRLDVDDGERVRAGLRDEHRQEALPLRADDDVDEVAVRALEQVAAFLLRDATGHGDRRPAARLPSEYVDLAKARVELVLCVLPDAARVDDDQVGVGIRGGGLIARLFQESGHPLRVVHVHLAAVGLDEITRRHQCFAFALCLLSPVRCAAARAAAMSWPAASSAAGVTAEPASMRAISSRCPFASRWSTRVSVRPPAVSFRTRICRVA
jgi:hypothetical protein